MLTTTVCTEPKAVTEYFDRRGWSNEARSHAEVAEVYTPKRGWSIKNGRKKISAEWLEIAAAEGITKLTLRVRYPGGSRVLVGVFTVSELRGT